MSILNDDRVKTPIHRVSLVEESDFSIFNNDLNKYSSDSCSITYNISNIKDNPEEDETVILTLVDSDFPDRTFEISVWIHQVNAAFLISQMLKTPMFMIAPSDDTVATLSLGPFEKSEVKVTIEAPVRRTPEFSKISKKIFELSKHDGAAVPQVNVSLDIMNKVRGELIDTILGLSIGKQESLLKAYSFISSLDRTNDLDLSKREELSESDMEALVMKDLLLRLEESTHPIAMSHMFSENPNSREYTKDIEEFESIISGSGMSLNIKEMEQEFNITAESSDEDVVAYINSPIDLKHIPKSMQALIMEVELKDFWEFKWHSALEENVNFKELPSVGEFLVSVLLVISVRMARMNELYNISRNADLAPLANITNGLTQKGESYLWVVKEAIRLLAKDKSDALVGLLTIPPDLNIGNINGPSTMVLHGLAHAAIDLGLPISSLEAAMPNEPNMLAFLSKVIDAKATMPDFGEPIIEELCFIKGFVLAYLNDGVEITSVYADEMVRAVQTLAQLTILKKTEFSLNTVEWEEAISDFYLNLLR